MKILLEHKIKKRFPIPFYFQNVTYQQERRSLISADMLHSGQSRYRYDLRRATLMIFISRNKKCVWWKEGFAVVLIDERTSFLCHEDPVEKKNSITMEYGWTIAYVSTELCFRKMITRSEILERKSRYIEEHIKRNKK